MESSVSQAELESDKGNFRGAERVREGRQRQPERRHKERERAARELTRGELLDDL